MLNCFIEDFSDSEISSPLSKSPIVVQTEEAEASESPVSSLRRSSSAESLANLLYLKSKEEKYAATHP